MYLMEHIMTSSSAVTKHLLQTIIPTNMYNVFLNIFRSSLELEAGCSAESTNCPLLSSVVEVSASVEQESCPPQPGIKHSRVPANVYKAPFIHGLAYVKPCF